MRVISHWANTAKHNLTDAEFLGFCLATVLTAIKTRPLILLDSPLRLRHALRQLVAPCESALPL